MDKALFSTPELAKFLGVFHTTVRRWIERGRIKGVRVGRNYKIPAEEVIRVLNNHNLPIPESLQDPESRPRGECRGSFSACHHGSALERLLIVEEIEDPAIICRKQAIIGANQAFASLVGFTHQAELIGLDVSEVIDGAFREKLDDPERKRRPGPMQAAVHDEARLRKGAEANKRVNVSVSSLKHLPDASLLIVRD